MDIHTYIRTVQEFELLKDIFFDKKSLTLFHFLSKCSVKNVNNKLVFLRHSENELKSGSIIKEMEIDKLYYSYQKMLFDKIEEKFDISPILGIILAKNKIKFNDSELFKGNSWIYAVLKKIRIWWGSPNKKEL